LDISTLNSPTYSEKNREDREKEYYEYKII